ncbi:MAG: hypothetical protein H0W61_01705 [Bacteroidetes bacterium]|nr:hypothetical protein [Bacteroidota bacterium]
MKTTGKTDKTSPSKSGGNNKGNKNISRPSKPGSDPDQTPNREVKKTPVAKPGLKK